MPIIFNILYVIGKSLLKEELSVKTCLSDIPVPTQWCDASCGKIRPPCINQSQLDDLIHIHKASKKRVDKGKDLY
jgi:hypothetical protein